jgi:NAD(P)-dependent dehydrogenase (short-subunit alcohol dehydrogenase family)
MRRAEVVVVTGASAGVGRATVRAFAKRGARVGLIARGTDGLAGAKRDVEALGSAAIAVPADVADAEAVERAADEVERQFGPIDVWVNNAMASVFAPVKETEAAEYRRVTEVTYLGVVNGTLAALRRMLPRNAGAIVQVGSALAKRSIPLQSAYCAAKHAIVGFTESLRCELFHDRSKVKVTIAHLPAMNTPQFEWSRSRMPRQAQPVPPIFQPEIAAECIVWLSQHAAKKELYVAGPTVEAVLGRKFVGPLVDRYLGWVGYEMQMTNGVVPKDKPDNLYGPVGGDHGPHGPFDNRARSFSLEAWVARNRWRLALGAVGLLGAGTAAAALMMPRSRCSL